MTKPADKHADRILRTYPPDRVRALIMGQKCLGGWSHVNWERVKAGLTPPESRVGAGEARGGVRKRQGR